VIHNLRRSIVGVVCAVGTLLNVGSSVTAQGAPYSYSMFIVPGASSTTAFGVNGRGEIVGSFKDASGRTHGFVRRDGKFTSIDYPEAVVTQARGISPAGDVVGAYRLAGEPEVSLHGYVLTAQARFVPVNVPGHASSVAVRRLADGTIIGCYHDADQMNTMHGMTLAGERLAGFDRPASMHTGATPDGKTIVGFYSDMANGNRGRGYVVEASTFTPFDVPESTSTSAQDVNASGAIVGVYQAASGPVHGFVRAGGAYTTLDVPDAKETRAFGINDAGVVVGSFVDAAGTTLGFVATRR
jgi:probable HAF family extracellular repeat protein